MTQKYFAPSFRPWIARYYKRLDLQRLEDWSQTWILNFNTAKCRVQTFSISPRFAFTYHLNGDILANITDFNDLGVNVTKNLSCKSHIRIGASTKTYGANKTDP